MAARVAVGRARKRGQMAPEPCAICGKTPKKVNGRQRIEAHHHRGYAPEFHLDIIWLCRSHHRIANRSASA